MAYQVRPLFILLLFFLASGGNGQTRLSSGPSYALNSGSRERVRKLNLDIDTALKNQRFEKAIKLLNKFIHKVQPQGYKNELDSVLQLKGRVLNKWGNAMMGEEKIGEAISLFYQALGIFENSGNEREQAGTHLNIGHIYEIQNKHSFALEHFNNALKLFEKKGEIEGMAGAYNNIGNIYESEGRYYEAQESYNESIRLYIQSGNRRALVDRYFNLGFLYEDQGNYSEALRQHQKALQLCEELGSKNGMGAAYSNMADVYFHQKDFRTAFEKYEKGISFYKEMGNEQGILLSQVDLAKTCISLKDYPLARAYLEQAAALSKKNQIWRATVMVYGYYLAVDTLENRWKEALRDQQLLNQYNDSISSQETTKKIEQAQLKFDFERRQDTLKYAQAIIEEKLQREILFNRQQQQALLLKEKELQLANNEKSIRQLQRAKDSIELMEHKTETAKNEVTIQVLAKEKSIEQLKLKKEKLAGKFMMGGLLLLLLVSFLVYRNYRNRQHLKLEMLRNKIATDLHDDVGSTLSSISIFSQMAEQQSKDNIPLLKTIGESSRKMLDAMADIVWSIKPENDQFEKIILRMKNFAYELLGAKNIDFEFEVDEEVTRLHLPMESRKNLYLIFKEATNNMVKYSKADKARFSLTGKDKELLFLIQDNGRGFDKNQSVEGNGIKNMRKRAADMGALFDLDTGPGKGTIIQLKLAV